MIMSVIFSYLAEHFDLPILDWIQGSLSCPLLDGLMPPVTALGNAGLIWIAAAICMLLSKKHRRAGLAMALSLAMGLVVCNLALKPLCQRVRPYDYQLEVHGRLIHLLIAAETDFSFPSGHTIASFEAATVLLVCRRKWGILALALACLIAFSRLYLYVHYPTDVLTSVILGSLIGLLAVKLAKPDIQR